jgi:general secretion pathway protein B
MPGGAAINPNDYVPAQPPAAPTPGTTTPVGGGLGGTTTSFATRESLLARGQQVPEASLSLHVYDAQPARRFVFINGQRGIEGDTLPSGLRIEQIVPEGVVLSWSGNRFLVPLQ